MDNIRHSKQETHTTQQLWQTQVGLLRLAQQGTVLQEAVEAETVDLEVVEHEEKVMGQARIEEEGVAEVGMATIPALLRTARRLKASNLLPGPKRPC